ncbi:MAG: fibronectin type III domain-containing protein [Oscillospiraceae bacterium]|nr:fibronectin type III domain-containing protein [Oscillospiraceae bacterium]
MKHAAKEQQPTKKERQLKRLKILVVLFLFVLICTAAALYREYRIRPGFLKKVWISERGADYLTVSWEKVRNVSRYVVMCDGKTFEVSGQMDSATVDGLKENTGYEISVRADSEERKGFEEVTASAKTKKATHITGEDVQTRFANRPIDLKQTAETKVTYEPGDGYTVTPDGKVVFTAPGEIKVTAKSEATEEYASVRKKITVNVLDTVSVDPEGAEPHFFYDLNRENCECVMTIQGTGDSVYPQSFVYYDDMYIVTYIKNEQRIITFGDEKNVYEPLEDLGHANGLAIANGTCYSVRGDGSKLCTTFEPPNSNYGSFELEYGAAGISYDPKTGMFVTSSRKNFVAYDGDFKVLGTLGQISRKETYYVQDCGVYDGILMHCVSGENVQGTNYIDFYDMVNSKYLGSIRCELNEIESILVDDEGFIELLSIGERPDSYIWKTPVNMKKICE